METTDTTQPTTTASIDHHKLEEFLGKVVQDFGATMSTTLSYIGDKLGLYKAMAYSGPLTSEEIADKTGTSERYVREWLINQAAGGYIEYDKVRGKYFLPDEHAIILTEQDSPFYAAGGFQILNGMLKADDRIIKAFKSGEGMLWGEHHHNLFEGTERFFKPGYLGNLVQNWLPALDGVVEKLEIGAKVADLGCGHGLSTIIMAKAYANSDFTGFDNHEPSVKRANDLALSQGLKGNLRFQVATAQNFPGENYDLITFFDCLHDMGDPVGALKHCYEALAQEGTIMAVEPMAGNKVEENFNPVGRVYSGASVMCCTPNAIASGGYALGTVATDHALEEVARKAGFRHFARVTETTINRIFEIRK